MRLRQLTLLSAVATAIAACASTAPAAVLLNDTFADGDRTDTNLPDESAFFVGRPDQVTAVGPGLSYNVSGSSEKLWTYFAAEDSPASLAVGDKIVATVDFTPSGLIGDTTGRGFRLGLFNDPTDDQLVADTNSDSGGGIWEDSTGYGVQIALSDGNEITNPLDGTTSILSTNIRLGKRVGGSSSLMGSSGAYEFSSGGDNIVVDADVQYSAVLMAERVAADQMLVTFSLSDAGGLISTHSILDDPNGSGEFGTGPIATDYEQIFFRFSNATEAAEVITFDRIHVEHVAIPEPATALIALLAMAPALRRVR